MPTVYESEEDLRGYLNERAGIHEVEVTSENLDTIARELLQTMENLEKSADLRTHQTRWKYFHSQGERLGRPRGTKIGRLQSDGKRTESVNPAS